MGKTFHVVHSIKGGCGKTAFSLFKALELAKKARVNDKVGDKARVLLLDADFRGTGLQVLVYAKDEETFKKNGAVRLGQLEKYIGSLVVKDIGNSFLFREEYQYNSLNDFLSGRCSKLSEIVTESGVVVPKVVSKVKPNLDRVANIEAFNGYLDFVFCSPDLQERQRFSYQGKNQPALSAGRFRVRMKVLLKEILNRSQYQDIVIDMPAGYDEYSDVLMEILREFCYGNKDTKIFYYTVSTADKSHLDAMREDVIGAVIADPIYGNYDAVYAVLSETSENEFEDVIVQQCKKEICDSIGDRIQFIKNCFQKEYYEFCRGKLMEYFTYELKAGL